jgi:hypothetical protein
MVTPMFEAFLLLSSSLSFVGMVTYWTIRPVQPAEI